MPYSRSWVGRVPSWAPTGSRSIPKRLKCSIFLPSYYLPENRSLASRVHLSSDMLGPTPALIRRPRPQSILLANELPLVQAGLVEICRSTLEYKVTVLVWDGGGAWRLIEALLPDIAVVDLRLSVRSGLEIIQRATQAKLSTKIIILASHSDCQMLPACLHAGARAFLLESTPSQEFLEALRQVAEGGIYISKELNLLESLSHHRSTLRDAMSGLPRRQFQVLSLLVEGFSTKAIASQLKLSPATVAMHRAKLMRRLNIHTVAGLVKFVFDRNPQLLQKNSTQPPRRPDLLDYEDGTTANRRSLNLIAEEVR